MSKAILKLSLAFVGLTLGWIVATPIFEFPDEQAHFGSISYLNQTGVMPTYGKDDLSLEMAKTQQLLGIFRDGNGNNSYTYHPEFHVPYSDTLTGIHESEIISYNTPDLRATYAGNEAAKYPPLYYRFTGFFVRFFEYHDIITRVFVARLANLLLVFGMALVIYQIGLLVFNLPSYAMALTFITLTQPMMSFVSAGVNSDNLHNFLFMLVIYFGLRLLKSGLSLVPLISLVLVAALDLATKPQGFITLALLAATLLATILIHKSWKLLIFLAISACLILYFFRVQFSQYIGLLTLANIQGIDFLEYLRFTSNKLMAQNVVWYWGVFKWLGVVLPPIYWRVANRIVLLSVLGFLFYFWRIFKKKKQIADPLAVGYLILTSIIYATAIFWYDYQHFKLNGYSLGIQARYFFPTLVAHLALLQTGLLSWGWNERVRSWLRQGLIILFLWLQLGGVWRLLSIYYDTSSISTLVTQLSQYKPYFVKGAWVYLWATVYASSLLAITYANFKKSPPTHNSIRASSGK